MWLAGKITQPTPPTEAIARSRLYAVLDRWPNYRLMLVRAAAGYGKTSLVSLWAVPHQQQKIAWLSLDQSDGDPVQFMRYFAAAIDYVLPGAANVVEPVLQDLQPDPPAAMRALLGATELLGPPSPGDDPQPVLFIIDDYHRVKSARVDELMTLALERAPRHLHFMILTRDLPALPLARLMVTGGMIELTGDDLSLDHQEMARFLQMLHLPALSTEQVETIMEISEGWVTGLKMAGLSLSDRPDPGQYLEQLHGASHWQAEYLTGEVLAQQTPDMQRFLLETSILERLNGRICEAVTGMDEASVLLNMANAAGLFLIPLDGRRNWYRYHQLFHEMLQLRLAESHGKGEIGSLHRRAAAWLEASGEGAEQAVDHYLAAGDADAAAALTERLVRQAIADGDPHAAAGKLRRLPVDMLDSLPRLLLLDTWTKIMLMDTDLIPSTARAEQAFEAMPPDAPDRLQVEAELAVCQVTSAFMQRRLVVMNERIGRANELQHLLDDRFRSTLLYLQFTQSMQRAEWSQAMVHARQAAEASARANDHLGLISIRREMGVLNLFTGQVAAAEREWRKLIDAYPPPQPYSLLRGLQYTLLQSAEAHYWSNNTELLRQRARAAAQIGRQLNAPIAINIAAQLLDLHNLNNPGQPDTEYLWPRTLTKGTDGAFAFNTELECVFQIRSGSPENALMISNALGFTPEADPDSVPLARLTAFTLSYVAVGRDLHAINRLMARGLTRLSEANFVYFLGRLQVIEAWRQLRMDNRSAATKALAAAIETAARTGLVRTILDIPELGPLLKEIDHPRAMTLATMMKVDEPTEATGPGSLTPSEIRVLELLAQDFRYDDIADRLSISSHTVRTHVKNIYRKLGVNRRLAAIEVVRQSGLIE